MTEYVLPTADADHYTCPHCKLISEVDAAVLERRAKPGGGDEVVWQRTRCLTCTGEMLWWKNQLRWPEISLGPDVVEPVDNDEAVEAITVAMLTLRLDTDPANPSEWRHPGDEERFNMLWREASATPGGDEGLLLHMMNHAWYAITYASVYTGDTPIELLAEIRAGMHPDVS